MDNKFKEGSLITAKSNPDRSLVIGRYFKRIYYCKPIDDPDGKALVYFERELVSPVTGQ
jgi:hypothetical protein